MQNNEKKNTEKQSTNFDSQKQRLISPTTKKIKIQQNIQNPNTRNIPHYVKRAIEDPKKIILERRSGEGSKPLFDRDDVRVNQSAGKSSKEKGRSSSRSSGSNSDSYRRGQNRDRSKSESSGRSSSSARRLKLSSRQERYKTRSYRRDKSHSPKKKDEEKVPYFTDTVREQDRIRQKYKNTKKSKEGSRERERSRSRRTKSHERRRSRGRTRSRSRSRSFSDSRRHTGRRRSSSRSHRRRYRSRSRSSNSDRRVHLPDYLRAPSQPFIPVVPMNYHYGAWVPPPIVRYPPYMIRPFPPVIVPPPPPPFVQPAYFRQRFPRFRQNFKQ